MSPTSPIYDHLSINVHPSTQMNIRDNSKIDCEKRKSHIFDDQSQSKRRYTVTNISIPEPIIHYSVNNYSYDKPMIQKSSTAQNLSSLSNIEIKSIDFRPLIIHGRKKFGTIQPSSSMIIIKKKSPSPMNHIPYNQKPLTHTIPVDIINRNGSMVVSSMIPSSLSYSSSYSSSSPTSASSTNVGTVYLPIQVTKSQNNNNNNNNNNNTIRYSTITTTADEGQKGYRYVQKQPIQHRAFRFLKPEKKLNLSNDDVDQSIKNPSSSQINGEGISYRSTLVMDSNVLRLIRRYDPVGPNPTGIKARRSLENTRGIWHTVASKSTPQPASDTSPFLSRRALTTTFEDDIPLKQPTVPPRLIRQQAIHEIEPPIPPPPPEFANTPIRPILKYGSSRSRSEFIVQPHQTEPLTIEIDPYIPPLNDNSNVYQPLITTGTKRVCSALSKSEWDLRIQQEQIPVRPPSPPLELINKQQPQEKESYRPTLGRSKSTVGINNNELDEHIDDFDENSAPIINNGACIKKLQQLFVTKSLPDSNQNRSKTELIELQPQPQQHIINKPTTITQENPSTLPRRPILRSQKTIDSPESVSQSNNSNTTMPRSEVSFDAYRFRRLNDDNSNSQRPRNIAKVEPYSINSNTIRPLYQSPPNTITTTTTAIPTKARINSMGNTPTNSSTSSSNASVGGMIRHSDFLTPNPTYPTPPILFSESLSHGPLHQLPAANINGRTIPMPLSTNNSQQKYSDFQPSMQTTSYHYRPPSTNNNRQQQPEIPPFPTIIEQQQDELMGSSQHQSRRRFQKRKQMKRSKSVDLYQETSNLHSPTIITNEFNKSSRHPRSISRECLVGAENLSSSSSSGSLTADIERVNRTALLRYKSLDSMSFNNRKSNLNGRTSNRKSITKPTEFDFDSDDSVCGIPKPRKLCTSSKNASKSDGKLLNPPTTTGKDPRENIQAIANRNIGSSGPNTGITNSVRKNETINNTVLETIPSTTNGKKEGISFAETQFYARSSNTPCSKRHDIQDEKIIQENYSSPPLDDTFHDATDDLNISKDQLINEEEKIITEPFNIIKPVRPLSSTIIINPFERLRPLDIPNEQRSSEEVSLQIFDQPLKQDEIPPNSAPILRPIKSTIEQQFDENNDSSTSTTTTNRSVHLPVEKQRGISEIIRKRNSRCKVEDYKRSIQKPNTVDDPSQIPIDQDIITLSNNSSHSIDIPIDIQNMNGKRAQLSIERLNLLLTDNEQQNIANETDESLSIADKRSLFETITKDRPIGGTLPRSKPIKNEDSSALTKTYANGQQRSATDDIHPERSPEKKSEKETFDDDTSKLSFKEKMILFNKKNPSGLTPTSSLKNNRNRLTQPITAEEVQAAVNLTPPTTKKQIPATDDENPEESVPVSKRLEQFKAIAEPEPIKPITSTRKTPTLKYNAKKTNTDQEHRAKTIDIVRLKTDSTAKPKDTNKTNGSTTKKPNNTVISVLKSDTISVLKPDDHLDDFFVDTNKNTNNESSVQLNTDDLNRIAENTVRLQSQAARVRPPRRQQQGAKNPLRQIQATIPTEDEYTEIHTNVSEQEVRRLKRAQIAEHAGLAQEALAALAATENFAEINLRKTHLTKFGYEPYKDVMLILIKGRRHCSLRLIKPTYESINEGDCYLLITPLKVFAWIGRYANSSEKSKATDLIDYLKQHRDFGLRNEVKYFILDQAKDDTENDIHAEFRDMLAGDIDDYKPIDDVTDDDFYETNITELNRIYRVENDLLIPLNDICFRSLSISILDPNEVLVMDFGSELYVWNGKHADKTKRNIGLQLAQQLWNDPYDSSECIINPFNPLDNNEQTNQIITQRPTWCILGKQNQNVETLLFKGKFYDWPNDLQEIKSVNEVISKLPATQRPQSIVDTLKPADVHKMLINEDNPVNMVIEQINLGRGKSWYDPIEKRGHEIQTLSLNVWLIDDNDRHEISELSYGQFYSDDVYIIRWRYKLISNEKKADINRDRVVYWIWQGYNANPNEKGVSTLMAMFVAEEKGPHIHVIQEHEEATFLQLFDGTLTIHMGKRNQSKERNSYWRLYVFLGEIDCETHWWELSANSANLRSRTSFLLINTIENLMLLWHGCGTTDNQQLLAHESVMKLRERCPEEFHFEDKSEDIEFFEIQEGGEIELFWEGINEKNHQRKYYSLLNVSYDPTRLSTIRIFHLSSLHGPFVAQELIYPLHSSNHVSPFPFLQSDLYELHQPALCLIDTDYELYIWQGWNDQADDELGLQLSNAHLLVSGPKDIRFTAERRCAFQTAIDYYKTKTGSSTIDIPCSIVYAGLEPIDFINLFPKWSVNMKARQQNQMEGKKLNQKDSIIDILNQLCRNQYTIEELRARPLPEGVDPSKIESYLSDTDFQKEFHMTKDEFYALPYWKQTNIKKPLGYF